MALLVLDALILYALAIPVVIKYRILPITGTPYWLFGLLFLMLTVNLLISLYPSVLKSLEVVKKIKAFFLWMTIIIVLGSTIWTAIVDRHLVAPVWGVHDIILQQEAAMRYLIVGKNPYKETYFGTPVESFHYDEMGKSAVNPALYHFVMPPWYLLFPFPFYFLANHTLGYFDGRIVLMVLLVGLFGCLWMWFKDRVWASLAVTLTALSPAIVDYTIEGRSDMFALAWLVASLFCLDKKKYFLASLLFGLALMSKQTVWFFTPFYVFYLWLIFKKSWMRIFQYVVIFMLPVIFLSVPFILWDSKAFFDSVVFYLSGNTTTSYPVSGYGLGMLLYEFGVIKNIHAYYPFILWQFLLGLPTAAVSLWWIKKKPMMSRIIVGYAATLLVIWYFSRYFNNSHISYISSLFILGAIKDFDEKGHA